MGESGAHDDVVGLRQDNVHLSFYKSPKQDNLFVRFDEKILVKRMSKILNRLRLKTKEIFSAIGNWVSQNWLAYNLIEIVYAVLLIPLLFWLSSPFLTNLWSVILLLALVLYTFLIIFNYRKFEVAEEDPNTFVNVEKLRNKVVLSYWLLLPMAIGGIFLIVIIDKIGLQESIPTILKIYSWVIFIWFGVTFYSTTIGGTDIPQFKKLLRLRVRTRFQIVSDALSDSDFKRVKKKIPLFREAITIYNRYLRKRYDFVIREPNRFYHYVKLMTYAEDDVKINEIKNGLGKLVMLLKEESKPFELIRILKEMVRQPISDSKDIVAEVEVDEPRIRKWFLANLNVIIAIIEIASLLVVVFGFFAGR